MVVVFALLAAAVLFAVVMVALGRGDLLEPAARLGKERLLPDGDVRADDLQDVRFAIAPRGYRMDQVDVVLDRLEDELTWRDERIAELEAKSAATPAAPVIRTGGGTALPRRTPGGSAAADG